MENAIEVQGLTKRYPGFCLDKVSFSVPSGSIVGFIGENGAGKSTTIKAILELIRRDTGEITILGRKDGCRERLLKEEIGVAFDGSYFPDNLRVTDVEHMMRYIYRGWEREKFLDLCRRFRLPEKKRVKEFSRGMKMKLAIAVALSHHTRLLILDEATSGLDPVVRNEILDLFLDFIQEEDHTVFLSSHITSDIEKIADYILLIHEGQILLFEDKNTLMYEYGLVRCPRELLGELQANGIVGTRSGPFGAEALIRSRRGLEGREDLVVDQVSLEDIMLFTVKSREERGL